MSENQKNTKVTPSTSTKVQDKKTTEEVGENSKKTDSPLVKLKQSTDVLLMLYPKNSSGYFSASIDPEDEITIYNLINNRKDSNNKKLLLLLDTSGGNVYTAMKIMDTLRSKYEYIEIAVPQSAKSSGTMMCCGADRIIMSSISELGPLDKPVVHPNDETSVISALDIIKSIDEMIEKALEEEENYARKLRKESGIAYKQSFQIASDAVSKLISPMLCREDVKIYNQAKRLLAIAEIYSQELLRKYMFSDIKNKGLQDRVVKILTRQLIWSYPDHAFAIRRNELKEWLFKVDEAESLDYWPELWREFESNSNASDKNIKFL